MTDGGVSGWGEFGKGGGGSVRGGRSESRKVRRGEGGWHRCVAIRERHGDGQALISGEAEIACIRYEVANTHIKWVPNKERR